MKQLCKFSLKYRAVPVWPLLAFTKMEMMMMLIVVMMKVMLKIIQISVLALPCPGSTTTTTTGSTTAGAISTITSSANTDSEHCSQMEAHFILQYLHICFDIA